MAFAFIFLSKSSTRQSIVPPLTKLVFEITSVFSLVTRTGSLVLIPREYLLFWYSQNKSRDLPPLALQRNSTLWPIPTVLSIGWSVNSIFAKINKNEENTKLNLRFLSRINYFPFCLLCLGCKTNSEIDQTNQCWYEKQNKFQ